MIRKMEFDDIPAVARILLADSSEIPWSENALATYLMREDAILLVLEEGGEVIAFAGVLLLTPEAEILDITVRKEDQGKGYGRQLFEELLRETGKVGCKTVYLEVRKSNAAARGLYKSTGFEDFGVRKNYYTNPAEDAIVMKFQGV